RQALAIPEIAILDRVDGAHVYRVAMVEGAPTVELVRIETGQRAGGMAEVVAGLEIGNQVITEGLQSVRPGQSVQIGEPPASQEPEGAATTLPLRPRG